MAAVRPVRDNAVVRRPQNQQRRGCRRRPLFATPSQSESRRCPNLNNNATRDSKSHRRHPKLTVVPPPPNGVRRQVNEDEIR
nr:hypothetical protein Iba_chr04aCG19180 [Ipomoea batatas]GMD38340.1 hypothetical protein Iba_scaffold1281050CG0010 [Ipomoea batatas]